MSRLKTQRRNFAARKLASEDGATIRRKVTVRLSASPQKPAPCFPWTSSKLSPFLVVSPAGGWPLQWSPLRRGSYPEVIWASEPIRVRPPHFPSPAGIPHWQWQAPKTFRVRQREKGEWVVAKNPIDYSIVSKKTPKKFAFPPPNLSVTTWFL